VAPGIERSQRSIPKFKKSFGDFEFCRRLSDRAVQNTSAALENSRLSAVNMGAIFQESHLPAETPAIVRGRFSRWPANSRGSTNFARAEFAAFRFRKPCPRHRHATQSSAQQWFAKSRHVCAKLRQR
jgi:hypothetical protein